jgi:hypothetical protein
MDNIFSRRQVTLLSIEKAAEKQRLYVLKSASDGNFGLCFLRQMVLNAELKAGSAII